MRTRYELFYNIFICTHIRNGIVVAGIAQFIQGILRLGQATGHITGRRQRIDAVIDLIGFAAAAFFEKIYFRGKRTVFAQRQQIGFGSLQHAMIKPHIGQRLVGFTQSQKQLAALTAEDDAIDKVGFQGVRNRLLVFIQQLVCQR